MYAKNPPLGKGRIIIIYTNWNLKLSQIINFNAISIWIFSLVCLYQFFTREITTLSTMR